MESTNYTEQNTEEERRKTELTSFHACCFDFLSMVNGNVISDISILREYISRRSIMRNLQQKTVINIKPRPALQNKLRKIPVVLSQQISTLDASSSFPP